MGHSRTMPDPADWTIETHANAEAAEVAQLRAWGRMSPSERMQELAFIRALQTQLSGVPILPRREWPVRSARKEELRSDDW